MKKRFSHWEFDSETMTLTADGWYQIDLELIKNPAHMLDWIFQLHGKVWGRECIAELLDAFDYLFHPQSTLCAYGHGTGIEPVEVINRNIKRGIA